MTCRDVYLRIEPVPRYSPVDPEDGEHDRHRRDCMRGHGHEDARVPQAEIERRRLDALVYREYLDPGYTVPRLDPMIPTDLNEPRWDRRVPACVLYADVGERLFVHVLNADSEPHSLHVHGLVYGIDSDGSWPFGVSGGVAAHGHPRRSDAICPGEKWCYVFDATEETIGAWPFHDHVMDIQATIDRGLFGGIVVRDPHCEAVDVEAPIFLHRLVGSGGQPLFDSGTLNAGMTFSHTFGAEGTYDYVCRLHPMLGRVRVLANGPASAAVAIVDSPSPRFAPDDVTIGVGGSVTWTHGGLVPHTVSDAATAPLDSNTINGRSFVGNTPTIVAESGNRIRWYVFNLDLGERWHNFHVHGQRFHFAGSPADTRSIGPAESFVIDTVVPPVLLLPPGCEEGHNHGCGCGDGHDGHHEHGHDGDHDHDGDDHNDDDDAGNDRHDTRAGGSEELESAHVPARRYCVQGDFLFHCHVEMHMMMGMVGLVRAVQQVRLTDDMICTLGFDLPIAHERCCGLLGHDHDDDHDHDDGHDDDHDDHDDDDDDDDDDRAALGGHGHDTGHRHNGGGHGHGTHSKGQDCPDVPHHPCRGPGEGRWERLADLDLFVVHAAVLETGRVLLWSGTAEVGDPTESRVWNPADDTDRSAQTYSDDLFCSGHAWLPDGRLLVAGGAPIGSLRATHIFSPSATGGAWTKVNDMQQARWYPTVLTLPDGRILAVSGSGATGVEVFDGTNWSLIAGATRDFRELYPSLHLIPSGEIFYSRAGWAMADTVDTTTAFLRMTGPATGVWTSLGQQQFHDRQEGMAVVQIDATVAPPTTRIHVIGGGYTGVPAARNPQSVETIDVTTLTGAAWAAPADTMNYPRTNANGVLLPDGTIFIVGGQRAGKWAADPQPVLEAEIYDPTSSPPSFTLTPPMEFPRQYHSIAVLLPDGRVLCAGGIDPTHPTERDQRSMEVFSPPYLDRGPRPVIMSAPNAATYGSVITVATNDAARVSSVVLIRPNAVTHHTDAGHRFVRIPIVATTAATIDVRAPADGAIAPPGPYMLFLVDDDRVPSIGHFIRLS